MQNIQRHGIGRRYAEAVVHNGTIYLAGDVADDPIQDIRGQTAQVLAQMEKRLAKLGSNKTKLLSVHVFLANIDHFDAMNEVWEKWLDQKNAPVRATVEARLAGTEYLVEMTAIAAQ